MEELTSNVNWLAVVIGFVAAYMLGWLWYSPKLFGEQWAEGVGLDLEKASEMPVAAMGIQAFGTFCLAWVVGITAASNALLTLILIVATFIFLQVSGGMFSQKNRTVIFIDAGYIAAMAVVLVIFQALL